jgi:prevent-host-death family protein
MQVTATEAKNRFGQMLDAAQAGPVIIEKSGRRHSVLLSMREYEALQKPRDRRLIQDADSDIRNAADPGKAFYAKYKEWVDWQNELVDKHGLWCDGLVEWQTGSADAALDEVRKVA